MRFYAVPAWQLLPEKGKADARAERLEPSLPAGARLAEVLARSEFRDQKSWPRAAALLSDKPAPQVYARPPNDLPALLRLADQLVMLARQEAGEQAKVWLCECGARYAVPVALLRPVSIRCDRCGRTLELEPGNTLPETVSADPKRTRTNEGRVALATFFREAMARGWVVMVEQPPT
jgi:hypothetical protein